MKKLTKIIVLIGSFIGLVTGIYKCSTARTENDIETIKHDIAECEKSLSQLSKEIESLKEKMNQQIRDKKNLKSEIKECKVEINKCDSDFFQCEKTVEEGRSSGCYAMELKTEPTVQSGPLVNTSCEGQRKALESTRDFLKSKFENQTS